MSHKNLLKRQSVSATDSAFFFLFVLFAIVSSLSAFFRDTAFILTILNRYLYDSHALFFRQSFQLSSCSQFCFRHFVLYPACISFRSSFGFHLFLQSTISPVAHTS